MYKALWEILGTKQGEVENKSSCFHGGYIAVSRRNRHYTHNNIKLVLGWF
jgi:hypothetical protein